MSAPNLSAFEQYEEPLLTRAQVRELINELPLAVSTGLRERLNVTLCADAPVPYAEALSELCAYLDGLEDAGTVPFEQLIQLKAFVMNGWKQWRAGFAAMEV